MRYFTGPVIALLCLATIPLVAASTHIDTENGSVVSQTSNVDQMRAEEIFASAEAAVWFPALRQMRWLATAGAANVTTQSNSPAPGLSEFDNAVEREFPGFRTNAYGPYLLKRPSSITLFRPEHESVPAKPLTTVFTESFESGMANWSITNNTSGLYAWGATTCEARTGSNSADAMRGGTTPFSCNDAYAANVTTLMVHRNCESLSGASQAWLDAYIHLGTESANDKLGFYYADATGSGYGYEFTGTASAWYHLVFNLKQWYRVGDLTTVACPQLAIQFMSNATTQTGIGARVDDITIGNATPSFLAASINATPTSGAIPLAVNFASVVSGATSAATYLWSFGDSAGTTASTPSASFTYTTAGDYRPRLVVTDGGARAAANVLIHATSAPTCSLSCTASAPATVAVGSSALFQATASVTGCSGTASYAWTFGDGQTSSAQNALHAYSAAGSYGWSLTVSAGGTSCTRSGTISVTTATRSRMRAVSPPAPMRLATATIGTAGGTLSGGGVSVTVAPGAFASSSTVVLSKLTQGLREEGVVSDTYSIAGLPSRLAAGMTIEVDVSGSSLSAGEKYFIATTASMFAKSSPEDVGDIVRMIPVEATQTGSKVSVTLPASWSLPSAASMSPRIETFGAVPMEDDSGELEIRVEKLIDVTSDHFTARVFESKVSRAQGILNAFEQHYQRLVGLGFSLDCRGSGSSFRRITIEPRNMGTGDKAPLGGHISGGDPCGTNWIFTSDYIEITTSYEITNPEVWRAAAHELFHLVQDMYSPGGARANLWLKEASSIWLENAMGGCPDVQNSHVEFATNGLFNSRNSEVAADSVTQREAHHGYGASYFLKYRTDQGSGSNDRLLLNLWTQIRGGATEVAAMRSALPSTTLADAWTQFAKAYFAFDAAGNCFPTAYNFAVERIESESSLPRSTFFPAYPLSARSWVINLVKFKTSAAQPATIRATGLTSGQSIYLFDRDTGSEFATLTEDNVKYEIGDLGKWSGKLLLAWFIDTNSPPDHPNNADWTNFVVFSISDETKLDKFPWTHQTQWNDPMLGTAAVWTSTSSGVVEGPKGSTVTVDQALVNMPTVKIRAHNAIGKIVISGTFLLTVKPMSGRKTNADGSYIDFVFSNPQFTFDQDHPGTGTDGNFRYELPDDQMQAGIIQTWNYDFKATCYDKQGKQTSCNTFSGEGAGMIFDFERKD